MAGCEEKILVNCLALEKQIDPAKAVEEVSPVQCLENGCFERKCRNARITAKQGGEKL